MFPNIVRHQDPSQKIIDFKICSGYTRLDKLFAKSTYCFWLSSFTEMPIALHISSVLFSIVGNFSHDVTSVRTFSMGSHWMKLKFDNSAFDLRPALVFHSFKFYIAATRPNCFAIIEGRFLRPNFI